MRTSTMVDVDGDELARADFEVYEDDGSAEPPLVWTGSAELDTQVALIDGVFANAEDTALKFEQRYLVRARHVDVAECNYVGDWSVAVPFESDDGADAMFDPSVVRRVELEIPTDNGPPSSWESIDAEGPVEACENVDRNYYAGTLRFEGATYRDVGIRIKGGCGSARNLEEKASFKVHLSWDSDPTDDRCARTRRVFGKKALTLNAGVQDATAIHEHLTFQMYRAAGIAAPRTAAVQVYVNGEYWGVYQNIETIDRRFVRRWFDASFGDGMMYEGAYRCDFFGGNDDPLEDGHCWEREFDLDACDDDPDPSDDLQWFDADGTTPQDPWSFALALEASLDSIRGAATFYPAVRDFVDWDRFLAYWAVSALVIDWDNYVYNRNNFRFFHDKETERWVFLPWGVDQTWVQRGGRRSDDFGLFQPVGDLSNFCLASAGTDDGGTCEDALASAAYEVLRVYESIDWQAEIDNWAARLDPFMRLEGDRKSYSYDEWLESVDGLRQFAGARAGQFRSQLEDAGYAAQ